MSLGTYRHLKPEELEPLRGRHWIGWGRDRDPNEFQLSGVAWSVPGHPGELLFVFQADTTDAAPPDYEPAAYTHIPHPLRLPAGARLLLNDMLVYADKSEFIAKLRTLARESSE